MANVLGENKMIKAVKFEAEWCAPCRMLQPIWAKLAQEFQGKIEFEVVDIDQDSKRAADARVSAVPTIVLSDGDTVVDTIVGLVTEEQLRSRLSDLV